MSHLDELRDPRVWLVCDWRARARLRKFRAVVSCAMLMSLISRRLDVDDTAPLMMATLGVLGFPRPHKVTHRSVFPGFFQSKDTMGPALRYYCSVPGVGGVGSFYLGNETCRQMASMPTTPHFTLRKSWSSSVETLRVLSLPDFVSDEDQAIYRKLGQPIAQGEPEAQPLTAGKCGDLVRFLCSLSCRAWMDNFSVAPLIDAMQRGHDDLVILPLGLEPGHCSGARASKRVDILPCELEQSTSCCDVLGGLGTRQEAWNVLRGKRFIASLVLWPGHWGSILFDRSTGTLVVYDTMHASSLRRFRAITAHWRVFLTLLDLPYHFEAIELPLRDQRQG